MIANLEKGRGFRGALNYALGKDDAKIIGGNMATTTPRGMAREFRAFRELRPKLKRAVAHVSLSVEKGVVLDDEYWSEIAAKYMKDMGYGDSAYTLVRHSDSEHDHVHIIASRIRPDGSVVSDSRDYARQERVMREIEQAYGLQSVPNSWETENDKPLKKAEVEMAARTGEMPARTQLQTLVAAAVGATSNYTDFALALDIAGVRHEVQLQKEGEKWNGVKFSLDGQVWFKGSDLGKKFTATGLQNNGVEYGKDRDFKEADSRTINRAAFSTDAAAAISSGRPGRPKPNQQQISESLTGRDLEPSSGIEKDAGAEPSNKGAGAGDKNTSDSHIHNYGGLGGANYGHGYNVHINALAVAASSANNKSQALLAKERAWSKQHSILQANRYRVTLRPRKDGDPVIIPGNDYGRRKGPDEIFYTAEEVTAKLSFFSKKNAQNYDVYVTPIDENKFYILVDDMTPESEKALLDAGYTPALVQESSDNNKQAILICARNPDDPDEQTHANEVTAGINKKYGDAKLSGAVRAFRMAGFANKKEGKGSPFTRIVQAANVLCNKTYMLIKQVKEAAVRTQEQAKENLPKLNTMLNFNDVSGLEGGSLEFEKLRTAAIQNAQKRGLAVDESVADHQAVKAMLKAGYSGLDAEIAIMQHPATSRKNDGADYARRTVISAENSLKTNNVERSDYVKNDGSKNPEI